MGLHRDRYGSDLDIDQLALDVDQLFAPEPERDVEAPKLIFTQPVDRTAQLFADEPVASREPADLDLRLTDELAPPRVRKIDPVAQPYTPRWKHRESPNEAVLRVFQGAAALVLLISILVLLLMPNGNRPEEARSSTAPRRLPVPQRADSAPDVSRSDSSRTFPSAASRARANTPVTAEAAAAAPRGAPPLQLPQAPATKPASAKSVVAATGQPRSRQESPVPARFAPVPHVRSLDANTAAVFGQPVAPPPAEVPPVVVARERGLIPKEEIPSNPIPTGTSGNSGADLRGVERDKVRAVLSGYERAYSQLDAAAAARLYPAVDRKALSRAFSTLNSQQILFEDCRIEVAQSTAQATCAGTASWSPKVGGGSRGLARRWQFDLRQVSGDWQIGAVKVQ